VRLPLPNLDIKMPNETPLGGLHRYIDSLFDLGLSEADQIRIVTDQLRRRTQQRGQGTQGDQGTPGASAAAAQLDNILAAATQSGNNPPRAASAARVHSKPFTMASSGASLLHSGTSARTGPLSSTVELPTEQRQRATALAPQQGKASAIKDPIKLAKDEVIYVPERLLRQKLNLKSPKISNLLEDRNYRVKVSVSRTPGPGQTFHDSFMEAVYKAFLKQEKPTDLKAINVELASYADNKLERVKVAKETMTAEDFELQYKKALCVLIPVADTIDPDFHQFKEDNFDSAEEDYTVMNVVSAAAKGKGKAAAAKLIYDDEDGNEDSRSEDSGFEIEELGKSKNNVAGPNCARCFKCCALLLPDDLDDGRYSEKGYIERAEIKHNAVCPLKDSNFSFTFTNDFEDAEGMTVPIMSHLMPEGHLSGVDPAILRYFEEKAERVGQRAEGRETDFEGPIRLDDMRAISTRTSSSKDRIDSSSDKGLSSSNQKGCCGTCGGPDSKDNMIQCESCKVAKRFHLSCVGLEKEPADRWQCVDCVKAGASFWEKSPQANTLTLGKRAATSSDSVQPAAKRVRPTARPFTSVTSRRSVRSPRKR